MGKDNVNDYLTRGIHGNKEIKRQEKEHFLGTFRERVIIALTQGQVRKMQLNSEIEKMINKFPKSTMLLNGEMEYSALSKYIDLADRMKIPYQMFSDFKSDTSLGLVLANFEAVDIEHIYVEDEMKEKKAEVTKKKRFFSLFKKNH